MLKFFVLFLQSLSWLRLHHIVGGTSSWESDPSQLMWNMTWSPATVRYFFVFMLLDKFFFITAPHLDQCTFLDILSTTIVKRFSAKVFLHVLNQYLLSTNIIQNYALFSVRNPRRKVPTTTVVVVLCHAAS